MYVLLFSKRYRCRIITPFILNPSKLCLASLNHFYEILNFIEDLQMHRRNQYWFTRNAKILSCYQIIHFPCKVIALNLLSFFLVLCFFSWMHSLCDRAERHGFLSRVLGGKRNGENCNQSRGKKSCLTARSLYEYRNLIV